MPFHTGVPEAQEEAEEVEEEDQRESAGEEAQMRQETLMERRGDLTLGTVEI
ncbi:MAG: hypothetical protein ACRCVL_03640 [Cetobacterium sp.]